MKVPLLLFFTLLLIQVSTQHSIQPRISNGIPTAINEFTFVATVRLSVIRIPYMHICHGVIIDEFWVLSTRVCVKATTRRIGKFRIIVGLYYLLMTHRAGQPPHQILKIAGRFFLNDTDTKIKPNDIGLFKVDEKIVNGAVVKLSQPGPNPTDELLMLGWGQVTGAIIFGKNPEQLQQANVTILTNQMCQRKFREHGYWGILKNTQICVNSDKKGISACNGDVGAPMIRYVNKEPEVVALVSWSITPCGKVGRPTIGIFVPMFIEWIRETMRTSANPVTGKDIVEEDELTSPMLVEH